MTTEEKAKAYDEVREKIALRFGLNVAEEIFSVFEESEDERIRKDLIGYFKDNNFLYHKTVEIVAWLEKQGEQKSDKPKKSQRMISAEVKEALYDKPTWSEEDEVSLNRIVENLELLNVSDGDILLKDIDWLKSLKNRVQPQTKEWGKEDEENMVWFDKFFKANSITTGGLDVPQERYLWLKSLKDRVQPKIEWSKEDEGMRTNIEGAIDNYEGMVAEDWEKEKEWLKSLKDRASWKPSEEQMELLKDASKRYEGLQSLYEQLKKI